MRWREEDGKELIVLYLSKRLAYFLLIMFGLLFLMVFVDVALRIYWFYWLGKHDIVSQLFNILNKM